MKKLFSMLLAAMCMALVLSGCNGSLPENTQATQDTSTQTDPTREQTHMTTQTTQASIEPTETLPASYTISLHAAVQIFSGPDYDHSYVRSVGADGVYTIVEETADSEGNTWGKLKSGIGWIDLTAANAEAADPPAATAAFADDALLDSGNFHTCIADSSEHAVAIVFRANETLKNVSLTALQPGDEGFEVVHSLYSTPELTSDKPLVAYVTFPGDMTTYGFYFTDSDGVAHRYTLTISGRNGALVFSEYTL